MIEYVIAFLAVVAVYMVWCFWKGFFYPVCSGSYLKLTSANPVDWCIVKRTYGDRSVRYRVGCVDHDTFREVSLVFHDGSQSIMLHHKVVRDYKSIDEVKGLIDECKVAYVAYLQMTSSTRVVKEEVV